jgi:hypothetical protein
MEEKNVFKRAALVAAVLLVLVILGLIMAREVQPRYNISTISAECASSDAIQPGIRVDNGIVIIVEPFLTPNPCYEVLGEVSFKVDYIVVNLFVESTNELCLECTGEAVGEVTISNLRKGDYGILVRTPQRAENTTVTIGSP